jgi:hypothetical protein
MDAIERTVQESRRTWPWAAIMLITSAGGLGTYGWSVQAKNAGSRLDLVEYRVTQLEELCESLATDIEAIDETLEHHNHRKK